MSGTLDAAAKAKLMEGLDFIENENDVEAVESAALKIQSTFRGKKIRSKIQTTPPAHQTKESPAQASTTSTTKRDSSSNNDNNNKGTESELSDKVAKMQVDNEKNNNSKTKDTTSAACNMAKPEDAEKAAAKIQAGFKGYKIRKELASGSNATGSTGASATETGVGGTTTQSATNKD